MPPEVASAIGTTINMAICAAWSANIPKFKRESSLFFRIDLKEGAASFNVLEVLTVKGVGTTKRTTKIADNDKKLTERKEVLNFLMKAKDAGELNDLHEKYVS